MQNPLPERGSRTKETGLDIWRNNRGVSTDLIPVEVALIDGDC